MFDQFSRQIREEALLAYPEEGVWVITGKGCRQVPNVAADPRNYFEISQADVALALAETLLAVVHSHPDGHPVPSEGDMRGQAGAAVPWGVLSTDGRECSDICWWGDQVERTPLIGRPFRHGVTDCYALIRDYYWMERGVRLPEFPRSWEWWKTGGKLFTEGFSKAGFVRIDQSEAQPGDVWLAQLKSQVPNHGGILVEGDLALHQAGSLRPFDPHKLSIREPVARYLPMITHWLRYVG